MPHSYERKTSDIFISDQLRNILEIFKDKSEVAKNLLYKRLNKDILVDEHINFICVSKNDPTKISYLSQDRIENIAKSETDDYWTTPKRFACKPGGFVGKILKDISPKEIHNWEKYCDKYNYIKPIVNYEEARKKSIETYKKIL